MNLDLLQFGDAPAIEDANGDVVSYRALDALVDRHRTRDIVRVPAARTVDFIARCLGAWRGGGAFVPVDPADPRPHPPIPPVAGLAYAISTSGSSGAPKHVLVGRGGLATLLRAQVEAFALDATARALWLHAPVFDASISDWGTVLAAGGCLVIPTARVWTNLRDELAARAITHVDLPPVLLASLAGALPPTLRVIVLGGEPSDVARVRAVARQLRVVVVYGPTEATVCSSLVVVDPARWERPLIGAPLPGVTYRVVDGELYIGGPCLALGYTDAGDTARAFVESEGLRMYRTGDRVEPTPHGLAFVGRVDRQTKVAGKRVDLDGIEAVLRRFVPNAAVVVRDARIVAFVDAPLRVADLADVLPPHLCPRRIVVGTLPRTATGKIDRAALVVPGEPANEPLAPANEPFAPANEPFAPANEPLASANEPLARAWCRALGVASVRDDDRFVASGGDSLARLVLQAMTGLAVEGDPTFAELAAARGPAPLTVAACQDRGRAVAQQVRETDPAGSEVVASAAPPPPAGRSLRGRAILVTGAGGLLGSALALALRARGHEVIAATRALLDVTRPIDRALRDRVATVIHCAATIQLGGDWDAHADANVRGTAEVAAFCGDSPWHHISTLSVFVNTDRREGRHTETSNPAPEARVFGGYAQTKVAAEAIARASGATIYRLGLLVDGAAPGRSFDQRAGTLRAIAKLGAVPVGFLDERFDETPVGYAAAAIAALVGPPACEAALAGEAARSGDGVPRTFHIAAPCGTRLRDAIGADIVELPHVVWRERADARAADPDIAMAIGAFSRRPDLDLFLATRADFAVEETAALLAARGVRR